jgi:hypothetical protein
MVALSCKSTGSVVEVGRNVFPGTPGEADLHLALAFTFLASDQRLLILYLRRGERLQTVV